MLKIELRASRLLAVTLAIAHACAVGVVSILEIPLALKLVAAAIGAGAGVVSIWRHALLRGAHAVTALEVTSEHLLNARTRSAGWREYSVLGSTYVGLFLTVLNLRDAAGTRRNVIVLPDSLHPEDYRKLRVWLRWKDDRKPQTGVL